MENSAVFVRFLLRGYSHCEVRFDRLWSPDLATTASMQMTKGTIVWISNYYTNYCATYARSVRTTSAQTLSTT